MYPSPHTLFVMYPMATFTKESIASMNLADIGTEYILCDPSVNNITCMTLVVIKYMTFNLIKNVR